MGPRISIFFVIFGSFGIHANGKEHVHFKIHVPEVIKHHIHTKTIYIHMHKPVKKKKHEYSKKNSHSENYHKDWSDWSLYNHHHHHHHGGVGLREDFEKSKKSYLTSQEPSLIDKYISQNQGEPPVPFYSDYREDLESNEESQDSSVPPKLHFEGDVTGYAYPPQYDSFWDDSREEKTLENNIEGRNHERILYEEKQRQGKEIQSRRRHVDRKKKIVDTNIQEFVGNSATGNHGESYGFMTKSVI